MERRLSAIMAADVVGYSRLMGEDEEGTLERLKALRTDLVQPSIATRKGRIVKLMGDGLLAEFPSVVEAVQCAVDIQEQLTGREAGVPDENRISLRIGINLGDIIVEGWDIYGDGVNVAARLEGLAEPGGICVSGAAFDAVEGKVDLAVEDMGLQTVKNIAKPVRVYRLTAGEGSRNIATRPQAALALPDKPSIAVLPFTNMSGDPEQEYFGDGITEDLITALSRLRWFFVIARNSTFNYKGQPTVVREVANQLGVRYILEGSIRRSADRVRVTAQLIDATSGAHVWADRYDREIVDIFDLQDEITANITAALEPELYAAEGARIARKNPDNLDAWDLFLKAQNLSHGSRREDNEQAESLAREALALDCESVGALKVLANSLYHSLVSFWATNRRETAKEALDSAERAVALDQNDAQAHQILGMIYLAYRRHDEAVEEVRTAIDLNPNFAHAFVCLGTCLTYAGEPEKALSLMEQAVRMSPRDPNTTFWRCTQSLSYLLSRDYDQARRWSKYSALRKDYWAPSRWYWAASSALSGDTGEVDAARAEVLRLNPDFNIARARWFHPFKRDEDFEILAEGLRKAGLPE